MGDLCFMELGETSEVKSYNCSNFNDLQNSLDTVADELQKIIDEYTNIAWEKKDWQILLESSQIKIDLLTEELEEVKMQLNSVRKSSSNNSVKSNRIMHYRRNSKNYNPCRSILNSHSSETSIKVTCHTCGDMGHKSFNCIKYSSEK